MKKARVIIIIIFILFLSIISISEYLKHNNVIKPQVQYEWNNGHCSIDGGRLQYIGTGSKYHYKCEICGKEYTFEGVQKYE